MSKNCDMDQEKTLRLKAEGREFAKKIRSLLQFVRAVKSQESEQFLKQNVLLFYFFRNTQNVNWNKYLGCRNL